MENEKKKYGKIIEGFVLREHVGEGTTADGKEFEISVAVNMSPLVKYKKKFYSLSWDDILHLAEEKGLFDEVKDDE